MKRKRRAYEDTTVAAAQSQAEIRSMLIRSGAEQFGRVPACGWEEAGRAVIGFMAHDRLIRIEIPLHDRRSGAFTPAGKPLRPGSAGALSAHDQEERRIWRAARAWIHAQLEAVASAGAPRREGSRTFEEAFLSDTLLADGQRFSQWAEPQMDEEVRQGRMPHRLSITAIQNPRPPEDH